MDLLHILIKKYFFTVTSVEHLLKLADEYQTKSVFDLCVNYLKLLPRSKENAVRILFLANITVMIRQDNRLDGVRSECCNLIKNMALQEILRKKDFKNFDRDCLEDVFVKKVERLEQFVKEVYPQFIGLVEFCMMLCLESSHSSSSKIGRCPQHFSIDNKANLDLFDRISSCAVCRSMISHLVFISKPKPSKQPVAGTVLFGQTSHSQQPGTGTVLFGQTSHSQQPGTGTVLFGQTSHSQQPGAGTGLFGQTSHSQEDNREEHRYGGTCHFDYKLTSIIQDFYKMYFEIALAASPFSMARSAAT